jgi:hypothetical protein
VARAWSRASFQLRQAEAQAELFSAAVADAQAWRHDDASAYRDARSRAAQVTDARQAVAALNEAAQVGDTTATLAYGREIVRHAAEGNAEWAQAAADYLGQTGYVARHRERQMHNGAANMQKRAQYWLPVPGELGHLRGHPEQIDALDAMDERATRRQRDAWDGARQRRAGGLGLRSA